MSTEKTRLYVGKGVKAGNFDLINISISKSKLEDHWFEYEGAAKPAAKAESKVIETDLPF